MADATETTAPPEGEPTTTNDQKGPIPDDPAALRAELERVRKEAASYRTKAKDLEDRDKTELQKLQDTVKERDASISELPGQVRKQAIRFASEASKVGFLDPEDALAFIGDVDLADADAVKAALADLAERKPHLVRADAKKKVPTRPKPGKGDPDESADSGLTGKKRAAAALRQMRS